METTTSSSSKCNGAQIRAALAVSLGSLVVGFTSAWSSPAIASLQAPTSSISVTDAEASWIGSLMPLAALAGGLSGGLALEKFGRKTTIMATSVPFMLAGITVTIASSVHMIYVGRVVAGFCIGVISLALPVYLAEILAPEVRGRLGMLPTSLGNLGVLVCYVAGARLDWSGLAAVSALLPIPFLITMLPVPESPSFLVSRHRFRAAQMSLMKLHGDSSWTDEQFSVLKAGVKDGHLEASESHVRLLLKDIKPISLCLSLMIFQQLSGINAVMFYSVTIFTSSGSLSPHLSTIILGVVNIFATVLSNSLIDKLGRKVLLYISSGGMIISLCVLGAHFQSESDSSLTPLAALIIYIVSFSTGFGPIPWLLMGELLPRRSRSLGASLATGTNWAGTFLVTKTFLDLRNSLGTGLVFWMYGVIVGVALVFVMILIPETKGKTLEEIEMLFQETAEPKDKPTNDV